MTDSEDKKEKKDDDPVALFILSYLKQHLGTPSPDDIARALYTTKAKRGDPHDAWRKYLPAVKQQTLFLARTQRVHILRHGEPVNPNKPIKGLIKLALPQ